MFLHPKISAKDQKKTILFLHIPKAAGTTLHHVIERQYKPYHFYHHTDMVIEPFIAMPSVARHQFQVVAGHFRYGLHNWVQHPYEYFSILREPIGRVVSFYNFVRSNPEHYLHDFVAIKGASLAQCLEEGSSVSFDNSQTRMIAGVPVDLGYGKVTEEHLTQAKENLRSFGVVGTMKHFDEILLLLKKRYGWKYVHYMHHNVGPKRPKSPLSPHLRYLIEQKNRFDIELYSYAEELFQQRISAQGEEFFDELMRFQQRNQRVQPLHQLYWRLRRISVRHWAKSLYSR